MDPDESAAAANPGGIDGRPGTYALVMRGGAFRDDHAVVRIGRLGRLRLDPGAYVYVGSAFGPGGVGARVRRHCRRAGRLHWHVDYLSRRLSVRRVWYTFDGERREHDWARALERMPESAVPLVGFGSSDCDCESHLFFFDRPPGWRRFRQALRRRVPDHAPISESPSGGTSL